MTDKRFEYTPEMAVGTMYEMLKRMLDGDTIIIAGNTYGMGEDFSVGILYKLSTAEGDCSIPAPIGIGPLIRLLIQERVIIIPK
jgi:hypothetical protein